MGYERRRRRKYVSSSNEDGGVNANLPGFTADYFDDCLDMFIRDRKAADRAEDTIRYYREQLIYFRDAFEKAGVNTRLNRITHDDITEYFIEYSLNVRKIQRSTLNTRLRAVRAFMNWAVQRGIIEESPMKDIVISSTASSRIETYSREQLREMFRQPDLETFVGLRDYTIMTLFLETGVRVRELVDIKIGDIRWEDSQIIIGGKNREWRLVPFQARARRVLKRYLKARGESFVDSLFITHDDGKMSRKAVQDRISKYGRMAGIDDVRNSPHTFRHTFAKMSVINGANLFDLQKILGHKTLEMVRVYVNLYSTEVAESHRRFSPIENLHI